MLYLRVHIAERDKILAFPFNHACFPPTLHGFSTHSSLCYLLYLPLYLNFLLIMIMNSNIIWGWGGSSSRSNLYKHKHLTWYKYVFFTILFSIKLNIIFSRNTDLCRIHMRIQEEKLFIATFLWRY